MADKNLFEAAANELPTEDYRMRAWLALVGCFTNIERLLRRRFSKAFRAGLPRYDTLTALGQNPDGLTMSELASMLMVSKGNITGVVRRLQEKRCVRQVKSRKDGRVQVVTLTRKGKELWQQMHQEYRDVVGEVLLGLTKSESSSLTKSLLTVQEKIEMAGQPKG